MSTEETLDRGQSTGTCPACDEPVFFAAGRGFCRECFITFAQPRKTRHELLSAFELKFFMSKLSGFYHREGCKYLRNVSDENLIVTSEPFGRPCVCIKGRR